MDVAVLGCGPAGLLSAHAAILGGCDVLVYSIKQKSPMNGAQYLHSPIPELTSQDPDAIIRYAKVGTRAGYATKVYGHPEAPCSWDKFEEGPRPAWSLSDSYEELWSRYGDLIID